MSDTEGAVTEATGSPTGELDTSTTVANESPSPDVAETGAPEALPYDWSDSNTWGERKPEDVVKEILKDRDGRSEQNKTLTSQLEAERLKGQQFIKEAEAALRDEKVLNTYRQKMGLAPLSLETMPAQEQVTNNRPPVAINENMSVREVQDNVNKAFQDNDKAHMEYTKQAVNEAVEMFKREVYSELNKSMAPMHASKWKSAMEGAESSYGPDFVSVRPQLVNLIDTAYANQYTGDNESALIEKVFRAEFPGKYEKYLMSKNASRAANTAAAATSTPSRSVATLPGDGSDASCIARANAKVDAALKAKGLK